MICLNENAAELCDTLHRMFCFAYFWNYKYSNECNWNMFSKPRSSVKSYCFAYSPFCDVGVSVFGVREPEDTRDGLEFNQSTVWEPGQLGHSAEGEPSERPCPCYQHLPGVSWSMCGHGHSCEWRQESWLVVRMALYKYDL